LSFGDAFVLGAILSGQETRNAPPLKEAG
jgi:hypothetical protein